MKKDKTPKGLISVEWDITKPKNKAYWALVGYYRDIINKDDISLSECRFIDSLLDTVRAVAENTKNKNNKTKGV